MDSTDSDEELSMAFKEVHAILQEESLRSLPLMVLLHKQDLNARSEEEVCVSCCCNKISVKNFINFFACVCHCPHGLVNFMLTTTNFHIISLVV